MAEPAVLIVDDEPGVAMLCQRLLGRAGFRAHAETDPRQAVAYLERESVDLLLADIRMPGLDGFELMSLARRRHPELAVVVMTGYGTVETALESLRRGADGLILKPFSEGAELVRSVQHALQENRRKRDTLRLQALRPLFDITGLLFAQTDPNRLQTLLLEAVTGQLRCEHAGLYHLSNTGELRLLAGRGNVLPVRNGASEEHPLGLAASTGMPVRLSVNGPGDLEMRALLAEHGYASLICAPVVVVDGVRILLAARSAGETALSEADLEMLVVLGHQAAVALENARLYAELRDYVRQVEESQRMLIQAEKMATVGRLTASIAHEINNPLQAVRNCLHLAGRTELPPERREEYLELAQQELERLMTTVQRMLDFYRPGVVAKKPADINELVRRVLKLMEREFNKRNVSVHTRLSSKLNLCPVVADQIQQVLLNLTLNGLEAMPDGGEITIETRQRKRGIEILVEDNGPGIPTEQAGRIFEPFISTKEKGTGLGLTVSYGIITAHGGALELITGRGKGACFRIFLPSGDPGDERGEQP